MKNLNLFIKNRDRGSGLLSLFCALIFVAMNFLWKMRNNCIQVMLRSFLSWLATLLSKKSVVSWTFDSSTRVPSTFFPADLFFCQISLPNDVLENKFFANDRIKNILSAKYIFNNSTFALRKYVFILVL